MRGVFSAEETSRAFSCAEASAARDRNNLYVASSCLADRTRYRAFCAMYASMRVVDDRIDALPSQALGAADMRQEQHVLDAWRDALRAVARGARPSTADLRRCDFAQAEELLSAYASALQLFPVPMRLWENFFTAMCRDIERPRFATYREFLDYSEGAAVAPTTINFT